MNYVISLFFYKGVGWQAFVTEGEKGKQIWCGTFHTTDIMALFEARKAAADRGLIPVGVPE